MVLPSHFNVSPANICPRAVRGRGRTHVLAVAPGSQPRRAAALRATSRSLPTFSGGGSWAEPLWKTAHQRIPTEGVRFEASPSRFRPRPLVPGLFSFRARVILLADGPTRPIQRLPGRRIVPPFPPPEPPLLSSASGWAALSVGLTLDATHAPSWPGVFASGGDVQRF
jgi:hypothetical protein